GVKPSRLFQKVERPVILFVLDQEHRPFEVKIGAGGGGVKPSAQGLRRFLRLVHGIEHLGTQQVVISLLLLRRRSAEDLQSGLGTRSAKDRGRHVQAKVGSGRIGRQGRL